MDEPPTFSLSPTKRLYDNGWGEGDDARIRKTAFQWRSKISICEMSKRSVSAVAVFFFFPSKAMDAATTATLWRRGQETGRKADDSNQRGEGFGSRRSPPECQKRHQVPSRWPTLPARAKTVSIPLHPASLRFSLQALATRRPALCFRYSLGRGPAYTFLRQLSWRLVFSGQQAQRGIRTATGAGGGYVAIQVRGCPLLLLRRCLRLCFVP